MIQQVFIADPVHLKLGLEEALQLEEKSFPVEGLAQELPGPGAVSLETLGTPEGPAVVMMIGVVALNRGSLRSSRQTSTP